MRGVGRQRRQVTGRKLTTRQALASSSRVTRRGRSGRTSTPSSSKRATTFGLDRRVGLRPRERAAHGETALVGEAFGTASRRSDSSRRHGDRQRRRCDRSCVISYFTKTHAGLRSGKAINPMIAVTATSTGLLTFHRKKHHQAPQRHERREPVADGDPRQQDTGTKDRAMAAA